jgi:FAD/FMN-containing dehydrogenase
MSTQQTTEVTGIESIRIGPDDPRYLGVVEKRFNKRFSASPDYVRLVSSTDQAVSAVEEAVREGRRLAVTSGGHCLEGIRIGSGGTGDRRCLAHEARLL